VSHTTIVMKGASEQTGVIAYSPYATPENPLVLDGLTIDVECTTTGLHATGIRVRTPARIVDSSIKAIGGPTGVQAEHDTWLERVHVESGYYGLVSYAFALHVDASQVIAPYPLQMVTGYSPSAYVGSSRLQGQILTNGSKRCVASYDGNYLPLDASCQPIAQ